MTLINKIRSISSTKFNNTSFAYGIARSLPKVKYPSINVYFTLFTLFFLTYFLPLFPLEYSTVVCVYEL